MSDRLVDAAERVAGQEGATPSQQASIEQTVRLAEQWLRPWSLVQGMRMRAVRSTLLRLLQPFTLRQQELDGYEAAALRMLADEVASLRQRVDALERESPHREVVDR